MFTTYAMASFKKFLVVGYATDIFDDNLRGSSHNLFIPRPFSEAGFRVYKRDIPLLADALQIAPTFRCRQRSVCEGVEGLCILLRRLSYPCRYGDMIPRFSRPVPVLSMIINTVLDYIYDLHGHRITHWNNAVMSPPQLQVYADATFALGSPLDNCFGFIDGTVRPICGPGQNQRVVYNGHKRVHALKFQSVALPNGIIGNMYGAVEGRRHGAGMLTESGLLQDLQCYAISPTGNPMCLYGGPTYPPRVHLLGSIKYTILTPQMQEFNAAMSAVRASARWLFGDITNYFKFVDFKKTLKIGLSSVGKMYVVCAILCNALTCLYGDQNSRCFGVAPPNLQDYFM